MTIELLVSHERYKKFEIFFYNLEVVIWMRVVPNPKNPPRTRPINSGYGYEKLRKK